MSAQCPVCPKADMAAPSYFASDSNVRREDRALHLAAEAFVVDVIVTQVPERKQGRELEDFLVLQVGVGSTVSASFARQIENAVDCPDRVEGAGVAALERHLARPVVVDPVLVA